MSTSVKMDEKSMQSFPVGMHVLAVDDDPLCLLLVEKLLRRCHYEVTTCGQAIMALTLLRENKEKFDLVISDVYMPEMDGFKLLELVELEMHLPVIMMSAFDEKSSVMKGITHGACDYLLKPIRIQELKNIWQHVVRRKWNETKDRDHSGAGDENDKPKRGTEDGEFGSSANCGMVGTFYKKRKEQKDGNDDENGHQNDDPSTLKKPRVVWTPDLHRQFLSAVNKLGIERAVPKRIMDLMNVQGLSRENVASHLQKYRLYLKKYRVAGNHPVDLGSTFAGGRELSFTSLGSVNGFGDFQKLATSGQLSSQALGQTEIAGSLSSLGGLGLVGPESSGMFQLEALEDSTNSIIGRAHITPYPANNQCNSFHGLPSELELKQIHQKQQISRFRAVEATMSEPVLHSSQNLFTAGSGLNNLDSDGGDKSNLPIEMADNAMLLQLLQQRQQCRALVSLPMAGIVDQHPRPIDCSGVCSSGPNNSCGVSVYLSNTNGFRRNWSGADVAGFPPNAWKSCTPLCDKDSSGQDLLETLLRDSNVDCESMDILVASCGGSTVTVPMSIHVSTPSFTEVSGPTYNPVTREDLSLSSVSAIDANMGVATDCVSSDNSNFKFPTQGSMNIEHQQGMNQSSKQGWHDQSEALGQISNPPLNLVSPINQELTYGAQAQRQNAVYGDQQMNSFKPLVDADVALSSRQCTTDRSTVGNQLKSREDHPVEPMRVENAFLSENSISMDDLMDSLETTTQRHQLCRWWHGM